MQSFTITANNITDLFKRSIVATINSLRKSFSSPTDKPEVLKMEQVTNIKDSLEQTEQEIQKKGFEQFTIYSSVYNQFKQLCHSAKKDLFIQENKDLQVAQVELFGGNKYQKGKKTIRYELFNNKHEQETIMIDSTSGQILNTWQTRPLQYSIDEYDAFYHNMYQMYYKLTDKDFLRIQYQFVGLQVQLTHMRGQWNISTKNTIRINESKLIGTMTVQQVLIELLAKHNISIEQLNMRRNYIFHLCSEQFTILPTQNEIFTVSVKENNQDVFDTIWQKIKPLPYNDTQLLANKQQFLAQIQQTVTRQGIPIHSLIILPLNRNKEVVQEINKLQINSHIGESVEYIRQRAKNCDRTIQQKHMIQFITHLEQSVKQNSELYTYMQSSLRSLNSIDIPQYVSLLKQDMNQQNRIQEFQMMDKQTLLKNKPQPLTIDLRNKSPLQKQTIYNYYFDKLVVNIKDNMDVKLLKEVVGNFVFDHVDDFVNTNNLNQTLKSDMDTITYKMVGMLIDTKQVQELIQRISGYHQLMNNIIQIVQLLTKENQKDQCPKCKKRFVDIKRHTKCSNNNSPMSAKHTVGQ